MTEQELYESVKIHLQQVYQGVFTQEAIEHHFLEHVETGASEELLDMVRKTNSLKPGQRLLDLGCGFGTFVLLCLRNGIDACGVEVADFDLDFARKRLRVEFPDCDPTRIYLQKDAQTTGLENESFDVITAWNLLEHVPDYKQLIEEVYRLLKPGGYFFGIAPNYLAFRKEAHYHLPWLPLFPRWIAKHYLQISGRRTEFFEQHIYYVTNWGILQSIKRTGFEIVDPDIIKLEKPDGIVSSFIRRWVDRFRSWRLISLVKLLIKIKFWNPFKQSVYWIGYKA